ncbi:hypothetical protein J2046_006800 [Rhizobium petrolearium]|uniref:hypothetical protein n=1 Tax=Neorhizobium petrolearium TaxID=515361 RepID=UPI001AE78E40|nr:hypothetical protein [Neorhizobium petrolearium]MBP1848504.1 hypothetical protein [Neorhizobium petrolearium]
MSVLNILVDADSATLITDGAGFRAGRLVSLSRKQVALPHLSAVVGIRGNAGFAGQIKHWADTCATLDELINGVGGRLRKYKPWVRYLPAIFKVDIAIVAHNGRAPIAKVMSSFDRPGMPAFEWMNVTSWAAPAVANIDGRFDLVARDPHRGAVNLVDAQRALNDTPVGGYVQFTEIDQEGITTRCLKVYRDKIGKAIDSKDMREAAYFRARAVTSDGGWR